MPKPTRRRVGRREGGGGVGGLVAGGGEEGHDCVFKLALPTSFTCTRTPSSIGRLHPPPPPEGPSSSGVALSPSHTQLTFHTQPSTSFSVSAMHVPCSGPTRRS